jgi:signal transduction histidine kinase
LFALSNLWDPSWWYWHVIKLIIYIGLIIGLAHGFSRTFYELFESRKKLSRTVDELKLAYDHLKNTQEELLEAEKLASIGKMAATISHEIRNPLGAIKTSVGIFKHHASLSPEDEELLDIIGKEINRLDMTISDFLGYAKPHPLQKSITNLNDLIVETISLLVHNGKASPVIKIKKLFDTYLPGVSADRNAMKQVLWNILVNALQAMPAGGTLTIKTLCTVSAHQDKPRSELSVIIADTGSGMSPETLSKAFQPFFSTKSKGTGLGLAIVERIIKQHGGHISLTSTIGAGTQVRIDIPAELEGPLIMKEGEHGVYIDSR